MQLVLSPRAIKNLKSIPAKDRAAIITKLEIYAETGMGDVIKLVGYPYFRLRHGDWRAILEMTGEIVVLRILHRREAY